tara:strand:+ start:246 stop:536 length:291 start_codon:yes stop_codon:yes gene_type:complete
MGNRAWLNTFYINITTKENDMGQVKNWAMEMQEYSWHLIDEMADRNISLEQARETFVAKYGQAQVTVLNDLIEDNNDEWRGQSDMIQDDEDREYGW